MGAGLCHRRVSAAPVAPPRSPPQPVRPCPKCGGSNRDCLYTAEQEAAAYAHLDGGHVIETQVEYTSSTSSASGYSADSYYR